MIRTPHGQTCDGRVLSTLELCKHIFNIKSSFHVCKLTPALLILHNQLRSLVAPHACPLPFSTYSFDRHLKDDKDNYHGMYHYILSISHRPCVVVDVVCLILLSYVWMMHNKHLFLDGVRSSFTYLKEYIFIVTIIMVEVHWLNYLHWNT